MAQAHAVKDRRQAHPYIPGARVRQPPPIPQPIKWAESEAAFTQREIARMPALTPLQKKTNFVRCGDHFFHQYLNSGVPEETLPRPAYAACPVCGKATAPIIGTAGVMCWECRWDCFMERITALEDQEGIVIAPRREDPASTRARWGFTDHIRVAVRHDLDPRVR